MATKSRRRQSVAISTEDLFSPEEHLELQAMVKAGEPSSGVGDSVQVAVRVRPLNQKDIESGAANVLDIAVGTINVMKVDQASLKLPENKSKSAIEISFTFDQVFDSSTDSRKKAATQRDIFDGLGAPLVLNAVWGYNASIFAYGQTGSGKVITCLQPGSASSTILQLAFSFCSLPCTPCLVPHNDGHQRLPRNDPLRVHGALFHDRAPVS